MWKGFLPAGMVSLQHEYYSLQGSRRCDGRLLCATLQLWLHCNDLLHKTAENGLVVMGLIQLWDAIQAQLTLGKDGISSEDRYPFEINIHDIMEEPGDFIRGWLCNM